MSKSKLRWIGLQFFADDGKGAGNDNESSNNDKSTDEATNDKNNENQTHNDPPSKTFTQEDVNRMLANEKRQGRQAALKALGLDPNDKDAEKKAKKILDEQKTDAEKSAEALKLAQSAQAEAERRAEMAEHKIAILNAGCKPEFLEEVTALATAKVTDDTTFEAALEGVKKKCAAFFEESENDTGTGDGQGHKRKGTNDKPGSFGARLAQKAVSSNTKENPYFKN